MIKKSSIPRCVINPLKMTEKRLTQDVKKVEGGKSFQPIKSEERSGRGSEKHIRSRIKTQMHHIRHTETLRKQINFYI